MSNMPSQLLKTLLTTHVGTSGWTIEIGVIPDDPDKVITIIDTLGTGQDPNPRWLLDYPTCQITVRGARSGYQESWDEAKAVKDLLLGCISQDVLGDRLVAVNMNGDVGFIGRDENMRPLFSMNYALIVEPQTDPNSNRIAL